MPSLPENFWAWALDGQMHSISIDVWGFKNVPTLRTNLYREARARNLLIKTREIDYSTLAFVAWRGQQVDFPGLIAHLATTVSSLSELPGYVPPSTAPVRSAPAPSFTSPEPTLEELVGPCSCGLGLDVHVGHPPTCAVWG